MKRRLLTCALLIMLWALPAQAEIVWQSPGQAVSVTANTILDESWLFLPSGADLTNLALVVDGEPVTLDWTAHASVNEAMPDVYTGALPGTDETLNVIASRHLRSVHLMSADPINQGRRWLEKDLLHTRETTGRVIILGADASVQLDMALDHLRGRGNSTWRKVEHKAPYQFKLEYAADVLGTGIASERSRTWVLLSHEEDQTFLRNQIALDLAKELGLESTSRCEQVDLYYDGDYRGTYLLCEKINVGPNSVDILDFDKLLEPVNDQYGSPDPDDLPAPTQGGEHRPEADGVNRCGFEYGYANGVYDNDMIDAGGYLLELESRGTLSDQGWFAIPGDRYIALKNPEYAGETMLRYVSELFMAAYETMLNYGYHPDTGAALEQFVDIDSFTRSHLVSQLLLCEDSYGWSSTFFVLPQRQAKFYAGPVWDFDRCEDDDWPRLKENNPLSKAFCRTTAFQRAAKEICRTELEPLVDTVLLGTESGRYLKPLSVYQQQVDVSWRMNYYRFFAQTLSTRNAPSIFAHTQEELHDFFTAQSAFLFQEIAAWGEDEPTREVRLCFTLPYGDPQDTSMTYIENEPHGSLFLESTAFECIEPATQDTYATWQATFRLIAKPGCAIPSDVTVYVNGEPYTGEIIDGALLLSFTYEDPTYRPAILDGVDYGLVFDYEYYVDNYPELLDQYGDDRQAILRYFRDTGMDMGDVAIEHFDPVLICDSHPDAVEKFGSSWRRYYEEFLFAPGTWMQSLEYVYEPELTQVNPAR